MQTKRTYKQMVDQEYTKVSIGYIRVYRFSCTQHPGHAKPDTGSRFTQKHERIGSQY
jgi:hypothetical protein